MGWVPFINSKIPEAQPSVRLHIERNYVMSRRWFRPSTPSNPSAESITDNVLTTALAGDLSRRLFSKRMLVAVPVAAAALLADAPGVAEAAPVADWTLTGNAIPDATKFVGTTNNQPLIFKTNTSAGGGERMRIGATGDVNIGTQESLGRLTVQTKTTSQTSIYGQSTSGYGVVGMSSSSVGLYGSSTEDVAIYGTSTKSTGVFGSSDYGDGTYGYSKQGSGVVAFSVNGSGLLASSINNYAGYFSGKVRVTGLLEKPAGSFKIDHPLDPENKYLYHSFVESPDMKNIYDGVATLDANGEATVELPAWFEALNRDFRYQLTCLGRFAPVYVAEEIAGNQFRIAGGRQGMKVSWQVTGIRQDAYAEAHRIPVEEDKAKQDRGKYLYPTEHGQPETKLEQHELLHHTYAM
jgi:hypothetical protein